MNDLGKKVFFLYPPSVVRDEMISRLMAQEYEVYMIRDHEKGLRLLTKYPDSIVYVNIDEGQSEGDWDAWIRKVIETPGLEQVGIGILTYNADENLQKKYLMDIGIGYGFVKLKLGLDESTGILLATLKASEAKGRRKFVRASCENDSLSSINIREAGAVSSGRIRDISSVGFSCVLDPNPSFRKNTLISDIQLKLRASLIKTEAIMFGSRVDDGGNTIYVFLFTSRLDGQAKEKIRNFIQLSLQAEIENELLAVAS